MKKKIGIIGSGLVARALASGFIKYGHDVMMGSRDPAKLSDWAGKAGPQGSTGSFEDAAEYGEILVLAVKGTAASQALEIVGADRLRDKTVMDVTNPIADEQPQNGVLQFFTEANTSLMETLQSSFPNTNFVKAFNSVGNALMVNPDFKGLQPSMFICGNNDNAKQDIAEIVTLFGWEVEDMGSAEAARAIEPLCILWCIPGFRENRWSHAFKLLKT